MNEDVNIPSNIEIDKALKEFEASSIAEQAQKASETSQAYKVPQRESGIQFETDKYHNMKSGDTADLPRMVRLVMKLSGGAIKEQKQAEYILLGIVVINVIITFIVIIFII